MRIISRKTLKEFWQKHPQAAEPLKAWHAETQNSEWRDTKDVKNRYRSADFLRDNRIVFNIAGNKYRLIVRVHYNTGVVFIRFVGTHAEYDKIDAESV
jgi:mRNA interferase HigB